MNNMSLNCQHADECSGCEWIHKPIQLQRELKIANFWQHWLRFVSAEVSRPEIKWVDIAPGALRDRVDLTIEADSMGLSSPNGLNRLGLMDKSRKSVLDLVSCSQMSPALAEWHKEFRLHPIPVTKGSVRLRVSPSGLRGVWLDLANIDVKRLLDEQTLLNSLRAKAIVEIGQRRKRLIERDGQLKLADPILEPWFETYVNNEPAQIQSVPLYCTIGTFTQPGFQANKMLVQTVQSLFRSTGAQKVAEFGSGIGNFTLPLASICEEVHAYEVDNLALLGLRQSLAEARLESRVHIHSGNFQIERKQPADLSGVDLVLADPPRSGLKQFLDSIEGIDAQNRPKHFIYVSCFAESFAIDTARLVTLGYRPQQISIVDQFPQSPHYEIVASFFLS
jgi:23S rRNA (uracil1939-C5)-methyltransferase